MIWRVIRFGRDIKRLRPDLTAMLERHVADILVRETVPWPTIPPITTLRHAIIQQDRPHDQPGWTRHWTARKVHYHKPGKPRKGGWSSIISGSKKHDKGLRAGQKKRPNKATIGDFEMMRVLGKGCANKVLLVRHRPTSDLFALKAITKRHALAHQELQHTLTEQAVLKWMAVEGKDPFVTKLWWSFHDLEHLFLVMDFIPAAIWRPSWLVGVGSAAKGPASTPPRSSRVSKVYTRTESSTRISNLGTCSLALMDISF